MSAARRAMSAPEPAPKFALLRDGRRLAYAEHGDPAGRPLFFFHGFPGSRLEAGMLHGEAERLGVRIVAPDRPGLGRSSLAPGRRLLDWPDDVVQLADALELERFAVAGFSGGGPYAAACAFRIPERVSAAGIAGSLAPLDDLTLLRGMLHWNRLGLRATRVFPWLPRPLLGAIAPFVRRAPELLVQRLMRELPPIDLEALVPSSRAILAATFREAFRGGGRGPAGDVAIYASPWGFELAAIEMAVHLWHGGADTVVPVAMGRALAARIPRCKSSFPPEDGHFSLLFRNADDIFGRLVPA